MSALATVLGDLRDEYLDLHTRKEDLFWITKMGLAEDADAAQGRMASAEIALNEFLQDPRRLSALRTVAADGAGSETERRTLRGWIDMLSAHVIDSAEGRALSQEIVAAEGALERARATMRLGFVDPDSGKLEPASSVKLTLMLRSEADERRRRAAFDALRSIETFVLEHGFLDIVRLRNRLGRVLGYEDYYDWRVSVVERMRKARLFDVLDDLSRRTADRAAAELAAFTRMHGEGALEPWNFPYLRAGAITREIDPYFSFRTALARWGHCFAALGVRYRGATLGLDLVDRPGKYENGFMHGPAPAFFDGGAWRPARINFTANAVPGQVGSGIRAMETLFHEGGHAAHFANVLTDAPCFSQEFAPTSVAYAETQSMFMDSLLGDAEWRVRHALDGDGRPMPMELVELAVREHQPFRGWEVRAMLTVPFAERALYEIPDAELGPERVLAEVRRVERETQALPSAARPTLAVPHLLSAESSAYYHGYVLAEMAVHQTRRFFLGRDGYLVDNPRIGPDLAEKYWAPGNSITFDETLRRLTGAPLEADALGEVCNRTVDEAIADARTQVERTRTVPRFGGAVELDATIRVCHGNDVIATTERGGFSGACADFERWIDALER